MHKSTNSKNCEFCVFIKVVALKYIYIYISSYPLFEEPFVVVCVYKFWKQVGGVSPKSKLFEELFCLGLDFFWREGVTKFIIF